MVATIDSIQGNNQSHILQFSLLWFEIHSRVKSTCTTNHQSYPQRPDSQIEVEARGQGSIVTGTILDHGLLNFNNPYITNPMVQIKL